MSIELNHTIIGAKNAETSASFLAEILGLPKPTFFGSFVVVKTSNNVNLDYRTTQDPIKPRHFAFLVSESEFDEIFGRIKVKKLQYWADPARKKPDQINYEYDGRGCYFPDPDGHLLEILTSPYK